jgi:hypothetical protein
MQSRKRLYHKGLLHPATPHELWALVFRPGLGTPIASETRIIRILRYAERTIFFRLTESL